MGFGSYPFGKGPFGYDPVTGAAIPPRVTAPTPIYDPATKTFPSASDGSLIDNHPVVLEVSLALGIRAGAIPSLASFGLRTERIRKARRDELQQVAQGEVELALARLIERGDVALESVVASAKSGIVQLEVKFRNLRDPGTQKPITLTRSL